MPRYICKVNGKYFEWSTIVDEVVTDYMTLDEFKAYYKEKYGSEGVRDLSERMLRVEEKGTSAYMYSIDELIPKRIMKRLNQLK